MTPIDLFVLIYLLIGIVYMIYDNLKNVKMYREHYKNFPAHVFSDNIFTVLFWFGALYLRILDEEEDKE